MSTRYSNMILFLALLIFTECIRSLKLLGLQVPAHVILGTRVNLSCRWALGPSEHLYSVKWYKDGKEFFRHVPANEQPLRKFVLPGVEVEVSGSDASSSNLTLSPVTLESSGRFRCEVSGEKPLFHTVSEHTDLEVIVLPDRGPLMSGLHPRYKIGDKVKVKCTSGKSHPAAQIGWYINGEPAPASDVFKPTYQKSIDGLEITSLVLNFVITEKHFVDSRVKIKCLVTQFPFYWRSNEENSMKLRNPIYEESEVSPITNNPIRHLIKTTSNCSHKLIIANLSFYLLSALFLPMYYHKTAFCT